MTSSEMRFELLKLVHRPGLEALHVINQVKDYEKFLNESQEAKLPGIAKSAPTGKKGGEPSK